MLIVLFFLFQLGDVTKKRSSTPDVLRTMSRVSSDSSRNDPCDSLAMSDASQQSESSPMVSYLFVFHMLRLFITFITQCTSCFRSNVSQFKLKILFIVIILSLNEQQLWNALPRMIFARTQQFILREL